MKKLQFTYPKIRPTSKYWVMKVAVISTSHLPGGCNSWEFDREICHMDGQGSSVILLTSDPEVQDFNASINGDNENELAIAMCDILEAFAKLGYSHVRFDPDGDVVKGLPTYE